MAPLAAWLGRAFVWMPLQPQGADYAYTPSPLDLPSGPVTSEQAARLAAYDVLTSSSQSTSDHAIFAPDQTVVIQAPAGQKLQVEDLQFTHDRIATVAAVLGRALAKTAFKNLLTDEGKKVDELAECVEFIGGQLDSAGQPPPTKTGWDKYQYTVHYWQIYEGRQQCDDAWDVLKGVEKRIRAAAS
jgi:hypothetical protein